VNGTELWILGTEFSELQEVFKAYLLSKQARDELEQHEHTGHGADNELARDDMKVYAARLSKWRRDVFEGVVVQGDKFIKVVRIMNHARAPVMHFLHFIEKAQAVRQSASRDPTLDYDTLGPLAKISCQVDQLHIHSQVHSSMGPRQFMLLDFRNGLDVNSHYSVFAPSSCSYSYL
jgi:hypothetical protein